jgi:hypothetical protein
VGEDWLKLTVYFHTGRRTSNRFLVDMLLDLYGQQALLPTSCCVDRHIIPQGLPSWNSPGAGLNGRSYRAGGGVV